MKESVTKKKKKRKKKQRGRESSKVYTRINWNKQEPVASRRLRGTRLPTAYDFPQIRGPLNETGNSEGFLKRISLPSHPTAHPSTSIVARYDRRKIIDQTRERAGVVTLLIIHSCHDKKGPRWLRRRGRGRYAAVINAGIMRTILEESLHESHWYPTALFNAPFPPLVRFYETTPLRKNHCGHFE